MKRRLAPLCLILSPPIASAAAFVGSPPRARRDASHSLRAPATGAAGATPLRPPGVRDAHPRSWPAAAVPSTALGASSAASAATVVAKGAVAAAFAPLRRRAKALLLLLLAAALLSVARRPALLWPGTAVDDGGDAQAPLPAGDYGCPFAGTNIFAGKKDYGPFAAALRLGQKYGPIFKAYFAGYPLVSVSGLQNVKALLKNEFKGEGGIGTQLVGGEQNFGEVIGTTGLLYENDKGKHGRVRRLTSEAMTPAAIGAALPAIQELAAQQVDQVLRKDAIQMEGVFDEFTLDIAWKQILGLDLQEADVPDFRRRVKDWATALMDPVLLLPFRLPGLMTLTRSGRARTAIVSKIQEKLAALEREGPDGSTMSQLHFAWDEDGNRLSREEVIDNALILILAGSETSASTLTVATLLLGLHPEAWRKVRAEQEEIVAEVGEDFTREALDKSVYLDAVIKETLRLKPLEMGEFRRADANVVVDGKRIPKDWFVFFNIKQTHWNDPVTFEEDGGHMDLRTGFRPERWLGDEASRPAEWMPFGEGRHRCVGERLGMAEMKVFLGTLARRVEGYELVNVRREGDDAGAVAWRTNTVMARPADGTEIRATAAAPRAVEYHI